MGLTLKSNLFPRFIVPKSFSAIIVGKSAYPEFVLLQSESDSDDSSVKCFKLSFIFCSSSFINLLLIFEGATVGFISSRVPFLLKRSKLFAIAACLL